MIITKNNNEAKLTALDKAIFSKVLEKQMNEDLRKNTEFTNDFQLKDNEQHYAIVKLQQIRQLEQKQFAKGAVAIDCKLAVKVIKSNAFLKIYRKGQVELEIKLSVNQLNALEDKYDTDIELETKELPTINYRIYIASTFMRNNECIYCKLSDLKLLRFCDLKYIK